MENCQISLEERRKSIIKDHPYSLFQRITSVKCKFCGHKYLEEFFSKDKEILKNSKLIMKQCPSCTKTETITNPRFYIKTAALRKCNYCNLKIPQDYFEKHINQYHELECCKCSVIGCHEYFTSLKERAIHMSKSHRYLSLCPFPTCHYLIEPAALNEHIGINHPDFKKTCLKCRNKINWNEIVQHKCGPTVSNISGKEIEGFQCRMNKCTEKFPTITQRGAHEANHKGAPFQCPVKHCNSWMEFSNLHRHFESFHQEGPKMVIQIQYRCSFQDCGKKFVNKEDMKQHTIAEHSNSNNETSFNKLLVKQEVVEIVD